MQAEPGRDNPVAEEFREEYAAELNRINVQAARTMSLAGAIVYTLFFFTWIDYLSDAAAAPFFLSIRLGVSAACMGIYFLAGRPRFAKHGALLSSLVLILCGLGISIMIRRLGYQSPYYAGLNIVYLACVMIPSPVRTALTTCAIVYLSYLLPILVFDLNDFDLRAFVNNNQFQVFTIAVVGVVSHFQFKIRRNEITSRLTIAKQAKELADRDKYKSQFIANITHELKTPLAIILGSTDLMLDKIAEGDADVDGMQEQARLVQQSALQLSNHVDRIMTLSMIDDPEVSLDLENYNYVGVVQSAFALFDARAKSMGIDYTLQIPETSLVINMDIVRIEEVLNNLVQNAFKFTNSGGSVRVTVTSDGEKVFTEVTDTGVGIAADKVEHVFERLYQADEVLSKRHGGMGLGLYISRKNVELHGGAITLYSKEGRGTTVRFDLPLFVDQSVAVKNAPYTGPDRRQRTQRRSGTDRRAEERRKRFEHQQRMCLEDLARVSHIGDLSDYENRKPSEPTIMVVEDNPGMMKVMVEALRTDYNLLLSSEALSALEKLDTHGEHVSLILADIMLPGMSGFDFCERVMEREKLQGIPLIFVTALMSEQDHLRGLGLGATDYVTKPCNIRILKEKVSHWIERRQYEMMLRTVSSSLEVRMQQMARVKDIILHEIRNPVQVIVGANFFINRLTGPEVDARAVEPELNKYLTAMQNGIDALNAVIDTTRDLDVAKLNRKPENLRSVVNEAVAQTEHLRLGLETDLDTDGLGNVRVLCERNMIIQVLVNLLRNAAEAVREKGHSHDGRVTVHGYLSGKRHAVVSVIDNGIGIPEEAKERLFRFKFTTKAHGTGIGLHFSRLIIKLHEGNVTVDSKVGEGSTFALYLPVTSEEHLEQIAEITEYERVES